MVGVRVLGAGLGAVLVNGAVVVAAEEGAGRLVEHVVAFLVQVEVLAHKFGRAHFQMAGDALNIAVAEYGTGRFATIGALQAVGLFKHLIMQLGNGGIQLPGRLFLELLEILFIHPLIAFRPLPEVLQAGRHVFLERLLLHRYNF